MAAGTTHLTPEEGMKILTPRGIETILYVDHQVERVATGSGSSYDESDLRAPEPPSRSPEDVEAWLIGPDLILVRSATLTCACRCNHCDQFVVTRGADITASHQIHSGACQCLGCCVDPLDSSLAV